MRINSKFFNSLVVVFQIIFLAVGIGAFISHPGYAAASGTVSLTGTITDQNDNVVFDVAVTLRIAGGDGEVVYRTSTNSAGNYSVYLEPGVYDVAFDPPLEKGLYSGDKSALEISDNTVVNLQLQPTPRTISGYLRNAAGNIIPNSGIVKFRDESGNIFPFTSDADGYFSVLLPPSHYGLQLVGGLGNTNVSMYSPTTPFDLTTASAVSDITVPMTTLHVTLKDNAGNPMSGVQIHSVPRGGAVFLTSNGAYISPGLFNNYNADFYTGVDGMVDIPELVGFRYAAQPDTSTNNLCAMFSDPPFACLASPLVISGETSVILQQAGPFTVSGVLKDSEGNPVANSDAIKFDSAPYYGQSTTTDSTGHYSIQLNPARYTPRIFGHLGNVLANLPISNAAFNLYTGDVIEDITIPTTIVHVKVIGQDGSPIGNTLVRSLPRGGGAQVGVNNSYASASVFGYDASGYTNSAGLVDLPGLVGSVYVTQAYSGHTGSTGKISVDLPDGQHIYQTDVVHVTGETNVTIQLPETLPLAPTSLTAVSPTKHAPILSWSASLGIYMSPAASYNIYRNGQKIGSSSITSYTDTTLNIEGRYSYTVKSVNSSGMEEPTGVSIQIVYDTTPPVLTHYVFGVTGDGTWNNSDVTVRIYCNDALTSVLDCPGDVRLHDDGANQSVARSASDEAGNTSSIMVSGINIDKTAPTITYTISPAPNSQGYSNGNVTVSFACNDVLSGIATCSSPVTLDGDGSSQTVSGTATDDAGNVATTTVTVNQDKTAPLITYTVSPLPNLNGWNNGSVLVAFNCSDSLSGIASCTSPIIFNSESAAQTATGTAVDNAGNSKSITTNPINIDETAPSLGSASLSANPITTDQTSTLTVPVSDNLSGVAGGEYYIGNTDSGLGNSTAMTLGSGNLAASFSSLTAGTYTINYRAVDIAGNWDLASAVVLTVKPLAPTNLTAASPTKASSSLSWTAVSGATNYNVYRDGALIGSPTGVTYTDTTAPEGSHGYTVTAIAGGVESAQSNTINVVYDKTAPSITYSVSPTPNTSGYNNSNVTVTFTCIDNLSGIQSCPSPVTLSSEGANQTVNGTATDSAGNSASTTATVNLDKTTPTISYTVSPAANANGYNNSNVTVTFNCNDTLSGIASCSSPVTLSVEGANQTVTGTATDKAGNTATTTATVNIDKTVPIISYTVSPAPNSNGYNNTPVTVTFSCTDTLSGVASCPSPVTLSNDGVNQTATGTVTDNAGNSASVSTTPINIDRTAPAISYIVSPTANAAGWNKANATVTFTCSDALSSIQTCPAPLTVSSEGANQEITGTAVDKAGNTASVTAKVNLDKTAPTISYTLAPPANSNSWNNGTVTVTFNCSDALSGVASCSAPVTFSTEGANQTASGTVTDKAGNSTSVTTSPINIDKTGPTISAPTMSSTTIVPLLSGTVTFSAVTSDSLSGVLSGEYYVDTDPGKGNGAAMTYSVGKISGSSTFSGLSVGQHTLFMRSKDKAGNWSAVVAVTFTYI